MQAGLDGIHAGTARVAVVGCVACGARGGLDLAGDDLYGGVGAPGAATLRVLCVQQELGAQVARGRGVCRAPLVANEAALFAQHSTLLDALEAHPTDDR